jgi:N-acetylmuramoyl-L-alanine amidase
VALASGCASPAPAPPPPAKTDRERAEALLAPEAALPVRAETVALADAVAIASARAGKSKEGAALARTAADLRLRLWRLDQSQTDAREALELYAAAAAAAAGTEEGCEADRRRALLAGELGRDAGASYRELYVTSRRQAVLLPVVPPAPRAACLAALDSALAHAVAYRPAADAMRALERDGNAAAEAALRGSTAASAPGQNPSAPSPKSAPPSAAPPSSTGDVVISPAREAIPGGPVKITSIERHSAEKGARVVVHLSGPATFNVGSLAADEAQGKDPRIFVDIDRASAPGIAREAEVGGAVRKVRVGAQKDSTRVVLDLSGPLHRRVFYLPDPFRIVVDVSTREPLAEERLSPEGKREVRRVAIDPGHGGADTGAVGPTGLREKDVTLDIAHRAAPLLAHELGVDTLLTRDSDVYVPLDLRAARANAFHADLFLSIHCNASEDGVARGVQSFYLDEPRDPEGLGARVAARENADRAAGRAGLALAQSEAEIGSILAGLMVGKLQARSRHFADLVQRSALASLSPRYPDTRDQGVRAAGFFVLAGADMPATLFETSFISNPADEARLATADYRQKMADAIVNAVRAYREGK